MAIVQISQITNRLGLAEDLPQLAGAEFGWSTDTRQLWIGNGTLEEGAPVIGNTEILTEFSDIINIAASYTYKGTAAGYTVQTGPTPGDPVVLSLQNWMDQWASVKDFGAVGDGVTDDTDAINRALYQLFCRQSNPQIRRSLFFPAGVYKVSGSILIPPYATLYGEGPQNSIIQLVGGVGVAGVVQLSDSLQQVGPAMGTNGATYPTDINVSNMAFQTATLYNDVTLIQSATNCRFSGVSFSGPATTSSLTSDSSGTAGVTLTCSLTRPVDNVVFDGCRFNGTVWGVYSNYNIKGVTVTNSNFDTLFQGVSLGMGTIVNGGPTGTRITSNVFDNIYSEGISFGAINLNATGYNIFYDVGDFFNGVTSPSASIISFAGNNNVSIGDMFQRTAAYSTVFPRISTGTTTTITTTNGEQLSAGTLNIKSGVRATLLDNQPTPVAAFTFNTSLTSQGFKVNYSTTRGAGFRTGTLWVVATGGGTLNFMDDYTENLDIGIVLSATQSGTTITVEYTAVATGSNATMSYSIDYLY